MPFQRQDYLDGIHHRWPWVHGLLGFITFIWTFLQAFTGLFLTIFQRQLRYFKLSYAQLRLYHATSGIFLFTLACIDTVLGLASNWFQSKFSNNTIISYVLWYLMASSIFQ
ncbi:unnamed protein product, partial [Didymodactylos carnosus]